MWLVEKNDLVGRFNGLVFLGTPKNQKNVGGKTISTVPSVPSSNSQMVSTHHYHRLKQAVIRKNMSKQQAGINIIKYGGA